jgi:hypothetical protein
MLLVAPAAWTGRIRLVVKAEAPVVAAPRLRTRCLLTAVPVGPAVPVAAVLLPPTR